MKLSILCLLLPALPLAAQRPAEITVRVVMIEKPGALTSLEAAEPDGDEKLFASLMSSAAAGEAKIIQDSVVNIIGGNRSKVQGFREFPVSHKADGDLSGWFLYPRDYGWSGIGELLEVEATASDERPDIDHRALDINFAPLFTSLSGSHAWPIPELSGGGRNGKVLRPLIANTSTTSQVMACTGLTFLVSVAPSPQEALSASPPRTHRYCFVRAGLNGEKPAKSRKALVLPEGMFQRRLHAITIRLPRDEAARLLLQKGTDDAALFDQLCRRIAGGTAVLSGHSAIFCRHGQRAKVTSAVEFPVPSEWVDLIPEKWGSQRVGADFEAEYTGRLPSGGDYTALWNAALQLYDGPEMVPYQPDANRPALQSAVAEQVTRKFGAQVILPPSGILCSGILSTSPATEAEEAPAGTTDVCFLRQSPPPGDSDEEPVPQILLQALVLSVPAGEGPGFAPGQSPERAKAAALLRRMENGDVHTVAHAALTFLNGQSASSSCMRNVAQPEARVASKSAPDLKIPSKWEFEECGVRLEGDYREAKGAAWLTVDLRWDTAPVLPFGEPGATIPQMAERRSVQQFKKGMLKVEDDKAFVADARPSGAREGTPEHGRWHVVILKVCRTTPEKK